MRSSPKIHCILMILGSSLILGQCGRKSSGSTGGGTAFQAGIYIPEGWDGAADWFGNALKVEELGP